MLRKIDHLDQDRDERLTKGGEGAINIATLRLTLYSMSQRLWRTVRDFARKRYSDSVSAGGKVKLGHGRKHPGAQGLGHRLTYRCEANRHSRRHFDSLHSTSSLGIGISAACWHQLLSSELTDAT